MGFAKFNQHIEAICLFLSSFFALCGFYFGIKIILSENNIGKGIFQCIITLIAFLTLIFLGIKSIKSIEEER